MKIVHMNPKKGIVKLRIQNQNDLWHLSHTIEPGDLVSSRTQRKIKSGQEGERNQKTQVRNVFLKVEAERIEFHRYSDKLRVLGKIAEGPEDITRGTYHTLTLEPSVELTIEKQKWQGYQLDRLREAEKEKDANILILLIDREKALFAELRNYGYEVLSEAKGNVQKKDSPEKVKSSFYQDVSGTAMDLDSRNNYSRIIVASPAFWREYLLGVLPDNIRKKSIEATCNSVDVDGLGEVLKRPEVTTALREDRVVRELALVEELLLEINRAGPACYGFAQTRNAVESGAVRALLVTDSLLRQSRQEGTNTGLDRMMAKADAMRADVHIISSEHDGGKKLDGLGGAGALLRYRLQ